MKKLILTVLLLLAATTVYAVDEWNEKDIAGVVDQIKSGKDLYESKYLSHQQNHSIQQCVDSLRY